jgi:hypothetical protein
VLFEVDDPVLLEDVFDQFSSPHNHRYRNFGPESVTDAP